MVSVIVVKIMIMVKIMVMLSLKIMVVVPLSNFKPPLYSLYSGMGHFLMENSHPHNLALKEMRILKLR